MGTKASWLGCWRAAPSHQWPPAHFFSCPRVEPQQCSSEEERSRTSPRRLKKATFASEFLASPLLSPAVTRRPGQDSAIFARFAALQMDEVPGTSHLNAIYVDEVFLGALSLQSAHELCFEC